MLEPCSFPEVKMGWLFMKSLQEMLGMCGKSWKGSHHAITSSILDFNIQIGKKKKKGLKDLQTDKNQRIWSVRIQGHGQNPR